MSERLQKALARQGLGSRRDVERWIAEGRVSLNGKVAQVGDRCQPGDRVSVDGKDVSARLAVQAPAQVLLYHKPQGQPLMRGADDAAEAAESVQEHLPAVRGVRWIPINPMHAGDSGLLLLTNDGALGFALTRRKRWIPTAYMVRVLAPGAAEAPPEIAPHVTMDDEVVEFAKVEPAGGEGANLWYRVELARADRRAAVRALFESRDIKVSRMTQVAFGDIQLPRDLPRMRHRALARDQLEKLYGLAQLPAPALQEPAPQRGARKKVAQHRRPSRERRSPDRKENAGTKKSPRRGAPQGRRRKGR